MKRLVRVNFTEEEALAVQTSLDLPGMRGWGVSASLLESALEKVASALTRVQREREIEKQRQRVAQKQLAAWKPAVDAPDWRQPLEEALENAGWIRDDDVRAVGTEWSKWVFYEFPQSRERWELYLRLNEAHLTFTNNVPSDDRYYRPNGRRIIQALARRGLVRYEAEAKRQARKLAQASAVTVPAARHPYPSRRQVELV